MLPYNIIIHLPAKYVTTQYDESLRIIVHYIIRYSSLLIICTSYLYNGKFKNKEGWYYYNYCKGV